MVRSDNPEKNFIRAVNSKDISLIIYLMIAKGFKTASELIETLEEPIPKISEELMVLESGGFIDKTRQNKITHITCKKERLIDAFSYVFCLKNEQKEDYPTLSKILQKNKTFSELFYLQFKIYSGEAIKPEKKVYLSSLFSVMENFLKIITIISEDDKLKGKLKENMKEFDKVSSLLDLKEKGLRKIAEQLIDIYKNNKKV